MAPAVDQLGVIRRMIPRMMGPRASVKPTQTLSTPGEHDHQSRPNPASAEVLPDLAPAERPAPTSILAASAAAMAARDGSSVTRQDVSDDQRRGGWAALDEPEEWAEIVGGRKAGDVEASEVCLEGLIEDADGSRTARAGSLSQHAAGRVRPYTGPAIPPERGPR